MKRLRIPSPAEALALIASNPISLIGGGLTTAAAVVFASLWVMIVLGFRGGGGSYIGLLTYMALPALFVTGLLLIPIGLWREKRLGHPAARLPVVDFNVPRTRNIIVSVAIATVLNMVVLSSATYKAVQVMDSPEFCGTACHSVMGPEWAAYPRSPHAQVACTECHIGSGADSFVKAKAAGSRRLFAMAFDSFSRPIPAPVQDMRAAKEICQACHNPSKNFGERLKVMPHFKDDEGNTATKTVVLMHLGGGPPGTAHGVHWHANSTTEVRFRSDASRQTIYEVEWKRQDGSRDSLKTKAAETPAGKSVTEWRTMDCIDCHNRPAHSFRPAETELDLAMAAGRIDPTLPFVKREGLKALVAEYPSHAAARVEIEGAIRKFYASSPTDKAKIDRAVAELATIWTSNIFPAMKVKWGSYPTQLGHANDTGCFRCHEGTKITQDCSTCHSLVAMEEADPKVLKDLGAIP